MGITTSEKQLSSQNAMTDKMDALNDEVEKNKKLKKQLFTQAGTIEILTRNLDEAKALNKELLQKYAEKTMEVLDNLEKDQQIIQLVAENAELKEELKTERTKCTACKGAGMLKGIHGTEDGPCFFCNGTGSKE